jgi:MFS family permease
MKTFSSANPVSKVGSVQDYISIHQLAEYSIRDVGWISAILVFLTLFLGVQVGPLFDRYGPRVLLICGSAASFTSYILLAECTKYWHFILCLSILGGVSSAVITTVSIAVLSHWFQRWRALASGLCMAGSSLGGAVIPLILQALFARKGWRFAIRTVAFVALGCYALGVIMVRGRLPGRASKAMIDFRAFRSLRLCFLTVAVFSFEFIIFGCAALLPTYVRFAGMSTTVQFYSLTVLNSMSFMGRVLPGFAADQFGRFNVLLCLVVVTMVVMAAVWLPWGSRNDATFYAVVAIFGFSSGGWLSLAPVCAGQLCRTEDYGRYYGTIYFVAAFGVLLTVPVGGDLLQSTSPQVLIGFYSAVLLVGFIALALSRWALLDWHWKWKAKL